MPQTKNVPSRRVLVVDDDEENARTLRELMELSGHRANLAYSGADALKLAEQLRPEVIFLDIMMPGMNGIEVSHQLRAQPWAQDTILVAVTGWIPPRDRSHIGRTDFDAIILKPASGTDLLAIAASHDRQQVHGLGFRRSFGPQS